MEGRVNVVHADVLVALVRTQVAALVALTVDVERERAPHSQV